MPSSSRRSLAERLAWRAAHVFWRFSRGMTLGIRAVVRDEAGRVFLVRHTYATGWHLPGGGVEPGETLVDALARELREEGNIELSGPARLFGMYFNGADSRRDHVAVFVVEHFRQGPPPGHSREIAESGFFASQALPEATTRATRARLSEILDGQPVTERW